MLENLCIFKAKKENRLITEFKETAEGNIMFVVGEGAVYVVFQVLSIFCSQLIYQWTFTFQPDCTWPLQGESQRMLR